MNIFEKRINYKPFEYPELMKFVDVINKTYWIHSEVDFSADKQDFLVNINKQEQSAIKNALLAISQIEVAVKSFWAKLYDYVPKPEFNCLGSTFAECEVRHSESYSRLLDVIGAAKEFQNLLDVPEIKGRVEFLSSYLKKKVPIGDKEKYSLALVVFSMFIENVSLFSQFAIILAFTRFKGLMKNTRNIIAWTSKDEQIHALAGIWIFNQIMKENPELFNNEIKSKIYEAANKAILVESEILNWIFKDGDIDIITKEQLINFMKNRINTSLVMIGLNPIFDIDNKLTKEMLWFDEEIKANTLDDFFATRPVEYSKKIEAITADSIF